MTDPLSLIPQHAFVKNGTGKFAPKLNHDERCAVLALVKAGVRRDLVARAFGLDRRTVGHIVNPQSARYKDVRNEYKNFGHEEFVVKYLTEEVAMKVAAAEDPEKAPKPTTSARSNRMQGIHHVKPPQCSYEHRVEIKYLTGAEAEYGEGWYFRDLDSKTAPDMWFHNGEESRKTSHACYDEMLVNLMDD